jgi:hypothetical protein
MVAEKFLTIDNLSPAVKNVQYAVRGKIVIRASELEKELKQVCKIFNFFFCINIMLRIYLQILGRR